MKEIRLLSSVFLESNGTLVQAPNTVLNTMVIVSLICLLRATLIECPQFIQNMRRSPQV